MNTALLIFTIVFVIWSTLFLLAVCLYNFIDLFSQPDWIETFHNIMTFCWSDL